MNNLIRQKKQQIRNKVRANWLKLNYTDYKNLRIEALEKITILENFLVAKIVFTYAPQVAREIDFMVELMTNFPSKKYCFPRVTDENEISFFEVSSYEQLVKQKFNILTPPTDSLKITDNIDLAFIPAVACDLQNNRLGRGKGFYDRFLSKNPSIYKVCVLPSFSIYDLLPVEYFDKKVDQILNIPI